MRYEIKVPEYSHSGIKTEWEDDFRISVVLSDNSICVSANSAGLISLAKHCLTLAQNTVPDGSHIHYDNFTSLEEGSEELIICKKNFS